MPGRKRVIRRVARARTRALSKQAYASVAALLTPEQAAAFHSIYPTPGTYMLQITFGGLPGVTASN